MPRYHHHRRLSVIEHEEEEERLLDDALGQNTETHEADSRSHRRKAKRKIHLVRALALLCACSLSVGSH